MDYFPREANGDGENRLFVCPMWQAGLLTILLCENKALRTQVLGVRSPAEQGTGDIQRVCRCKLASGLLICRLVSGRCLCSLVDRAPRTCSLRFIFSQNSMVRRPACHKGHTKSRFSPSPMAQANHAKISSGLSAIFSAPCSIRNSRPRNPHLTPITSIPALAAVSTSTSESPI